MPMSRFYFLMGLLLLLSADVMAAGVDPLLADADRGPWPELSSKQELPLRVRWFFRPFDLGQASARLDGEEDVERMGILDRFGGAWILEAAYEDLDAVEAAWAPLGELIRDKSGTPSISRTTALVGVRPRVWEQLDLLGDMGAAVAILDSGCDAAHDDLGDLDFNNQDMPPLNAGDPDDWRDASAGLSANPRQRVIGWTDVTDDVLGSDGPYDYHYHGTALAGAGFAQGRYRDENRGVAPEGRLVVVKTYNFEGRWEVWASDLLLGIDWVLDHVESHQIRACLIGAVWDEDLGISIAVQSLLDAGVAVIAPSGNDPGGSMGWPSRIPGVITVGACDADGRVAAYQTPGNSSDLRPDLVAPGGGSDPITGPIVTCDNEPDDSFRGRVGTSIAAAHLAGAVSLISQAMRESGRAWRQDRAQVQWLQQLLRATAIETGAAEPGASSPPPLDRGAHDTIEGFGLMQVDAAVNAVRRSHWVGDQAIFDLGSPVTATAVWAARMPWLGGGTLQLELNMPQDADFDLYLYREETGAVLLEASSTNPTLGAVETLELTDLAPGNFLLMAKRVTGEGEARLKTRIVFLGETEWPIFLSAVASSEPVPYDYDNDGSEEIFLAYNVAILDSGHLFSVHDPDASAIPPFPRDFYTGSSLQGDISGPAVADLGQGTWVVTGSEFGSVYSMDMAGQLRIQAPITANLPTTSPAIRVGASTRIVVGTVEGAAVLDAGGVVVDRWILGGGASGPPALGDLSGDGQEDIVICAASALHARTIDGVPLSGWPVIRGAEDILGAPVIVGGAGGPTVVVAEHVENGSVRVLALTSSGQMRSGFPVTLAISGSALVVGQVVISRIDAGPPRILLATISQDLTGQVRAGVHEVNLDGSSLAWPTLELEKALFVGETHRLTQHELSPVRVGELLQGGGAEVLFGLQLAWEEFEGATRRRYGSVQQLVGYSNRELDPRLGIQTSSSHPHNEAVGQKLPLNPWSLGAVIADLDDDGFSELLTPRGNRIYLQSARVANEPLNYWGTPRNGPRRGACVDCDAAFAVDSPSGSRATQLSLGVHPNPFNPRTMLEWSAPRAGTVQFSVVDVRGRRLRQWSRQVDSSGSYRELFRAVDHREQALASGVYRVLAEMDGERVSTPLVLVR